MKVINLLRKEDLINQVKQTVRGERIIKYHGQKSYNDFDNN
jgi:hypothetical protein